MIVLDTNALIWWINGSKKLSRKAKKKIKDAEKNPAIYISSISILEIYVLLRKGRLQFDRPKERWLKELESLPYVHFVPLDNKIAVQSVNLVEFSHKDPADRIIIATAQIMGAVLITSDKKILSYEYVQTCSAN